MIDLKKLILLFLILCFVIQSSAQGTIHITSGANIKTSSNAFMVLDNMNLTNNGTFIQEIGDGTNKLIGNTNTTITGNGTTTLDKLEIALNNGFINSLGSKLSLKNVLRLTSGQLESGGFLVLISDANSTARVAPVTSKDYPAIIGNVIVERFINSVFNRGTKRLLTAPVRSTTGINGTIYDHWQKGGKNISGMYSKTRGVAFVAQNRLSGFTPGTFMQWWNGIIFQRVETTTDPTITPLFTIANSAANKSFLTFLDEGVLSVPHPSNSITLSAYGSLQTLDQTFATNTLPDGFTLIGNPYASPVELDKLRLDNRGSNIKSTYYYWDPYLTGIYGYGAYVTVSYDNNGLETITPADVAHTQSLQSGQAMFVQTKNPAIGIPSVTFREKQKEVDVNNRITTISGGIESIGITLSVVVSNTATSVDGIVVNLNNNYSLLVDDYDAVKLYNTGENIAFIKNGMSLTIERRPLIKSSDVLFLNLTNLKPSRVYQFKFDPLLNPTSLHAYLIDNYLKLVTPIDLNKSTTANFTINTDAGSTGANRFRIVFSGTSLLYSSNPTIAVYPNPVTNGIINLQLNNMPPGIYNIKIFNPLGQIISTRQINHAQDNIVEHINLGTVLAKGEYLLEVIKPDKSKFSTKVIAY